MLQNNLLMLDMDETPFRRTFLTIHSKRLERARQVGAILDCATSDISLYIYAKSLEDARFVEPEAQLYNDGSSWEDVPQGYKVYWF